MASEFVNVSQTDTGVVSQSASSPVKVSNFSITAVYNVPADDVHASQLDTVYVTASPPVPAEVSQFDVVVVYRGRIDDPRLIAWTFTLDGHDYYVLRLGTRETLVYDTFSEQWYVWGTGDKDLWRAYCGTNWRGIQRYASVYGSDIVVGDDGNGAIYVLDPDGVADDNPLTGSENPKPFTRSATVQAVLPDGYGYMPCYGIQIFGSVGQTDDTLTVEMEISDDRGQTFMALPSQTINAGDVDYRLEWLSLGSMRAPGRLFRISDQGALHRIDGFRMYAPGDG